MTIRVDILRAETVMVHRDHRDAAHLRGNGRDQSQRPYIGVTGRRPRLPEIAPERRSGIAQAWRLEVDNSRRRGNRREQRARGLEQDQVDGEALRNELLRQRNRNSLRSAHLQVRQDDCDAACHAHIVSAFLDLNREDLWHPGLCPR